MSLLPSLMPQRGEVDQRVKNAYLVWRLLTAQHVGLTD